jgi:hypothetical protein
MTKTDDVRVLRKGTCPSLTGRSELTYEFGHHNKSIMFRITENTGSGHFCAAWIPLDDIFALLNKAKETFSLSVFRPLYPGLSINNSGFLGAVLKKEGLIVCEKRQYIRKDSKAFVAGLNKLITTKPVAKKPTLKKGHKATTSESKEQP